MEIDEVPEPGNVLRALVGNPCNVILIDDELGFRMLGSRLNFMDVDDGAVGDAATHADAGAPLLLFLIGRLARFFSYESHTEGDESQSPGCYRYQTKCVHEFVLTGGCPDAMFKVLRLGPRQHRL
jgi:hypothetical protein